MKLYEDVNTGKVPIDLKEQGNGISQDQSTTTSFCMVLSHNIFLLQLDTLTLDLSKPSAVCNVFHF